MAQIDDKHKNPEVKRKLEKVTKIILKKSHFGVWVPLLTMCLIVTENKEWVTLFTAIMRNYLCLIFLHLIHHVTEITMLPF